MQAAKVRASSRQGIKMVRRTGTSLAAAEVEAQTERGGGGDHSAALIRGCALVAESAAHPVPLPEGGEREPGCNAGSKNLTSLRVKTWPLFAGSSRSSPFFQRAERGPVRGRPN